MLGPHWSRLRLWRREISDVVGCEQVYLTTPGSGPQHPGGALSLPGQPEKQQVCEESCLGEVYQENIRADAWDSGS